jgi:zinc transport system substrate-binding protein
MMRSLAILAAIFSLSCSDRRPAPPDPSVLRVVVTTFPLSIIARNVAAGRDGLSIDLLLAASAGCPHDYIVTPQDVARIESADVLITNGLGLDAFAQNALAASRGKAAVIVASQGISDLIRSEPESAVDEHGHHHETEFNPHLFASPRQAARMAIAIGEGLANVDPSGAALYRANAAACAARLDRLADEFAAAGKSFAGKSIVTQHEVFDYLARDIGITVTAVVDEVPGRDPTAAEMIALIDKIRGASAVFTEPQYPSRTALTIAREAGVPTAVLDPVATGPENAPLDYYEKVMAANLVTLRKTLGK